MPNLMIVGLLGGVVAIVAVVAQEQATESPQDVQISGQAERQTGAGDAARQEERPGASRRDRRERRTTRPQSGQSLLEHAILTLESRRSVSANVLYSVDLFGQRPAGQGVYLEQRSERGVLLRYETRFQLAGQPSSLLQVCDGRYLWVYRKLEEEESLTRVDVARVQQELEATGNIDKILGVGWWPGLGGLPRLLRGLHGHLQFDSVEEAQLESQTGPVPVWKLQGQWKPEELTESLPGKKQKPKPGKPLDLGGLPGHVPDHVVLYLGKTDEFPYRIEYRRRAPDGTKDSGDREDRPILTMRLCKVHLNATIHPTHFLYNPGDLKYTDRTVPFLKELGLRE